MTATQIWNGTYNKNTTIFYYKNIKNALIICTTTS